MLNLLHNKSLVNNVFDNNINIPKKEDNFTLTWKNLTVFIKRKIETPFWKRSKTERVAILNNAFGLAQSGRLLAIMGQSGSGKTTLLASISLRNKCAPGGSLLLDGLPMTPKFMASISGFAPQKDFAFENLTLLEHLTFMAAMILDCRLTEFQRRMRIDQLLRDLGISDSSGSQLRSLSGGERKRVSICAQLLSNPSILFCDEPTSGLDSWVAASVVNLLRDVALTGKIVICSIHQPASGIFDQFHDILLLADGRTAFHGSTAEAKQLFEGLGMQCPIGYNYAEYLVKLLSVSNNEKHNIKDQIHYICEQYIKSLPAKEMRKKIDDIEKIAANSRHNFNNSESSLRTRNRRPLHFGFLGQFRWLIWRKYITDFVRSSLVLKVNCLAYLSTAVLICVPSMNMNMSDQQVVQNLQGILSMTTIQTLQIQVQSVSNMFFFERPIMQREIVNGLYSVAPYYVSKMITMVFVITVNVFLYGLVIFWLAGLRGNFEDFMLFQSALIMGSIAANSFGLLLAATFDTTTSSSLVAGPYNIICMFYAGFFMVPNGTMKYSQLLEYVSYFRPPTEIISIVQWRLVDHIDCDENSILYCIRNGLEVLTHYGYNVNNIFVDFLKILLFYIAFNSVGFAMAYRKCKQQVMY